MPLNAGLFLIIGGIFMGFVNQVKMFKKVFYLNTIVLLISILLVFLFNHVFINFVYIVTVSLEVLIIFIILFTFILYCIGWIYTELILFYYRKQAENTKE